MEHLDESSWRTAVDAMLALESSGVTAWCDAPCMLSPNPCHDVCELADTPPVKAPTSALHMVVSRQQFYTCQRKGNVVSPTKEFEVDVKVVDTADPTDTVRVDARNITVKAQLVYADNHDRVPHAMHAHEVQLSHFDSRLPDYGKVVHGKCAFRLKLDKTGGFLSSKHNKRHFRVKFVATFSTEWCGTGDAMLTAFTDAFEAITKPDRPSAAQ